VGQALTMLECTGVPPAEKKMETNWGGTMPQLTFRAGFFPHLYIHVCVCVCVYAKKKAQKCLEVRNCKLPFPPNFFHFPFFSGKKMPAGAQLQPSGPRRPGSRVFAVGML